MAITGDEEGLSEAIRSFVKYFNTIKPYHTKILEILEQYNFTDELNVSMLEDMAHDYTIANQPLCSPVELGTEFDEGFTFSQNYVIVAWEYGSDQVIVDGDATADIAVDDYIFLHTSVGGFRPIKARVLTIAYETGDITRIGLNVDIQSGVNDDFTRLGSEFCNLFTTIAGGFGVLYDDDKIVVEAPYVSDDGSTEVTVSGNYSYDKRYQISMVPNSSTVIVAGDITDVIDPAPDAT